MSNERKSQIKKIKIDFQKKITLYGSYYPEKIKHILTSLRDYLVSRGFLNTKLVEDYPDNYFSFKPFKDPNVNNKNRSFQCTEKTDLNVLIFCFDSPRDGPAVEITHILENNYKNFLVFVEEEGSLIACTSLIQGFITEIGRNYNPFPQGDLSFLCDIVYQKIIDYFLE